MSEISKYDAQKKKMQGLCDEHDLVYRFHKDTYPITFTISPMQGMDAQMSMLEDVEDVGYRSPDASMTWVFEDGALSTQVSGGTFSISKSLRTKIENVLLKMITFWQQYFFRDIVERGVLKKALFPVIDESEARDDEEPAPEEETDEEPEDEDEGDSISLDEYLIQQATRLVRAENTATTGLLQRRLKIGFAKAGQLMNELEARGVIAPYSGGGPREVLPCDEPEDAEEP